MHSSGKETALTGVWSPSAVRAESLAAEFGVPAFRTFEELMDESEAIDFAIPPASQARLAIQAAGAGRALLLEKPLADTLAAAIELVDAVTAAAVPTLVFFTKRYQSRTRDFLEQVSRIDGRILAITGRYVHGGFLETGFVEATSRAGWRAELGVLFDLGPHLLDLADAAGGSIRNVTVTGDPAEAIMISTTHESGAVGEFLLSGRVKTASPLTNLDVYAHSGHLAYSTHGLELSEALANARAEFAGAVREGKPVTVDVHRALEIQREIEAAARSLEEGRTIEVGVAPASS